LSSKFGAGRRTAGRRASGRNRLRAGPDTIAGVAETGRLAKHFAAGDSIFISSPLYRSLCRTVAGDRSVLELLVERQPGQQPSFLLFGAVHYLLLGGAAHPLGAYYPSLHGAAAADPSGAGPALLDFCRAYRDELAALIRTRLVQTNVVKRSAGLRIALWAVGQRCAQPVHLIEVGTSAGIHLHVDRYRYVIGGRTFGLPGAAVTIETQWRGPGQPPDLDDVPAIASRTGVDLHPVAAADAAERLWLRALVWPENQHAADLLMAALDSVAADPPAIVAGDAISVCPRLGRSLPPGEPRVVFHAATRMHVPRDRRAAFDEAIDSVAEGGPLFHVWLEPPSVPHHGMAGGAGEMLAMHGPGDAGAVPVARVDGHLEWAAAH
jgi:hypothetical protein